jgi:hypothetical protein
MASNAHNFAKQRLSARKLSACFAQAPHTICLIVVDDG